MEKKSYNPEKFLYSKYPEIRQIVLNKRQLKSYKNPSTPLNKATLLVEEFLFEFNQILSFENSKDFYFSYFKDFCIQKNKIKDETLIKILNLDLTQTQVNITHLNLVHNEYFKVQKQGAYMWFYLIFNSFEYPSWLKYWALKGLEKMAFNSKNKKIIRRNQATLLDFPEIIPQAYHNSMQSMLDFIEFSNFHHENQNLSHFFSKEYKSSKPDFWDIYNYFYQQSILEFQDYYYLTDGIWIDYNNSEDSYDLYSSLINFPVAWCLKSLEYCKKILSEQSLTVYYTQNYQGNFEVPRMAILYTTNQDKSISIDQFKGVENNQSLDYFMYKEQNYIEKFLEILSTEEFLIFIEEVCYRINIIEHNLKRPDFQLDIQDKQFFKNLLDEEFQSRFSFISKERINLFLEKSK